MAGTSGAANPYIKVPAARIFDRREGPMTIKTILVAASGGSASDGAVELGCRLARRFGAHLEGFHARPDARDLFTYSGDGFGMSMSGDFVERFAKDAETLVVKTKASFDAI